MPDPRRAARLRNRLEHLEAHPRWVGVVAPEGVAASVLSAADVAFPVVRCVTELGCPAAHLMAFLVDDITQTLPAWSRDIDACSEVERLSPDERILLVRTRGPLPVVWDREDLFYAHRGQHGDSFYEVSEVTDEVDVPVARGAVRSHLHFASKRIVGLSRGGCRYEAMWQYDMRGCLGALLPLRMAVSLVHDHLKDECVRLRERYG
ncbi:MAG: hypothetical protein KTR31_23940 [Myxococcales bacterium]|nr:hypothetical protein [Myxococcales bacterium]